MIASDKNGADGNVSEGGFGGNHGTDGGNIVRGDGSAKWVETDKWTDRIWGDADLSALSSF